VAGFISEWWPESNRNGGRHQIGIPGRIASEFASLDALVRALDKEIIEPAEVKFDELVVKKAETMKGRHVS
jgi:hypothetical protein